MLCPIPSRPKASANARNSRRASAARSAGRTARRRRSRRRRRRTGNRRVSSASLLLDFPDEAPDQRHDRRQREHQPDKPQIDVVRPDDQIEHQREVVRREEAEADAAPQQQACRRCGGSCARGTMRMPRWSGSTACRRSSGRFQSSLSLRSLNASANAVALLVLADTIARRTVLGRDRYNCSTRSIARFDVSIHRQVERALRPRSRRGPRRPERRAPC